MSEQRTSGTATVMFTDVESSTDITTRLGDDAAASLLATHNTIVLDQVAAFGGHDVRSTGDGFLVVFDSARAAVSCALAIQRELTEREHPIRVRIGLNAGEVLHGGGDELFGAAINLAARVMDRADGGEILTTDTVRQLVGTMTEATFRDRGRVALKGFAERQRLWEVRPAEARPAHAAGAPAHAAPLAPHADRRRGGRPLAAAAAAVALLGGGSGSASPVAVGPELGRRHRSGQGSRRRGDPGGREPGTDLGWRGRRLGAQPEQRDALAHRRRDAQARRDAGDRRVADGGGVPGNVAASAAGRVAQRGRVQRRAVRRDPARGRGGAVGRYLGGGDDVPVAGAVPEHPISATESGGCGLVAQGSSVWAATNGPDGLVRIDYDPVAGRSRVTWGRPLPAPWTIALGYGSLWAVDPGASASCGSIRRSGGARGRCAPGRTRRRSPAARGRCGWPTRATTPCRASIRRRTWSRRRSASVEPGRDRDRRRRGVGRAGRRGGGGEDRPGGEPRDRDDTGGPPAGGHRGGGRGGLGLRAVVTGENNPVRLLAAFCAILRAWSISTPGGSCSAKSA